MKKILSVQALMSDGKVTYSGLFDENGDPVEIELESENGSTMMSVVADVDDEDGCLCDDCRRAQETAVLSDEEIDRVCALHEDCEKCPLYDYCECEEDEE